VGNRVCSGRQAAAAAGDIGGFGVGSKFAWQLFGALGYELNPRTSLQFAAYRWLDADYPKDDFVVDTHMDGPLFGVTFNLLDAKTTTVAKA
jgi:hypothetical protein